MYVPKNVFTNNDLMQYMDTSDEWIQERTGIRERRFAERKDETTTTIMATMGSHSWARVGVLVGLGVLVLLKVMVQIIAERPRARLFAVLVGKL